MPDLKEQGNCHMSTPHWTVKGWKIQSLVKETKQETLKCKILISLGFF